MDSLKTNGVGAAGGRGSAPPGAGAKRKKGVPPLLTARGRADA